MSIYHVVRTISVIHASCRLRHICGQLKVGYSVSILMPLAGVAAVAIVCRVDLMRLRKSFEGSSGLRGWKVSHIQGVPGGMCQTSGGCSLC